MVKVSKSQLGLYAIAIIIIGGLIIFNVPSKANEPASTLKIHYYYQGKEVYKDQYSIIDGQKVDAIGFDITVYNNGDTLLKNLRLTSSSPYQFTAVLPTFSGDLTPKQSKTFSTTANIPVAQFEGQTVTFAISLTATDDYSKQDITKGDSKDITVYKEEVNARDYYACPNNEGDGWGSCTCPSGYSISTLHPIDLYKTDLYECYSTTYKDYAYIAKVGDDSSSANCLKFGGDYISTGKSLPSAYVGGIGVCYHPAYKDYMLSFPTCTGQNGCGGTANSCPCLTGYNCVEDVSIQGAYGGYTQCIRTVNPEK